METSEINASMKKRDSSMKNMLRLKTAEYRCSRYAQKDQRTKQICSSTGCVKSEVGNNFNGKRKYAATVELSALGEGRRETYNT